MIKFGITQLPKPTPKAFGRIGWALFLTCQTSAATFAYFGDTEVAKYLGIVGFVGLFLANLFGHGDSPVQS